MNQRMRQGKVPASPNYLPLQNYVQPACGGPLIKNENFLEGGLHT